MLLGIAQECGTSLQNCSLREQRTCPCRGRNQHKIFASMSVSFETDKAVHENAYAAEDDGFTEVFAQLQAAAQEAMNSRTPEDVLEEYFPMQSSTLPPSGTRSPTKTRPTSISIHDEALADVSEIASGGTLEIDDPLFWGLGANAGPGRWAGRQKTTRLSNQLTLPAFAQLPTWVRIFVAQVAVGSVVLAVYGLRELLECIRIQVANVSAHHAPQDASFWTTYFPRLTKVSGCKAVAMSLNGLIWLCSAVHCAQSFRQMLTGAMSNRTIQVRLLILTPLWLACCTVDGILRLRTREEISLSMMTILMLMFVLSTFARHLAVPSYA
ncbi:uncharacterized protein PV09_01719 [Verruconis gallopava]|uniref:Transmembrane protein n=1 Tax=Verruconis gallopava TaxID=253628 RepID=A0A0D2AMR3_9PEZI|nr:uncharacterized protein PV09_01719 [Verruconis gallopava]KIW07795.1 hypothetical protein PV09_01719 [Verruconis gallopava]